jgi:hypothetical protein
MVRPLPSSPLAPCILSIPPFYMNRCTTQPVPRTNTASYAGEHRLRMRKSLTFSATFSFVTFFCLPTSFDGIRKLRSRLMPMEATTFRCGRCRAGTTNHPYIMYRTIHLQKLCQTTRKGQLMSRRQRSWACICDFFPYVRWMLTWRGELAGKEASDEALC